MSELPTPLHSYETRHRLHNFDLDALDNLLQEAASSSIPSSPTDIDLAIYDEIPAVKFKDFEAEAMDSDEEADPTYCLPEPTARRPYRTRRTDQEKVVEILRFMKAMFPKFSLRKFLVELFSSEEGAITNWTGIFLADGGAMEIMDLWWAKSRADVVMENWVIERAAGICRKETGWLTDNARHGPHFDEAKGLRLSPGDMTVNLMNSFRLRDLGMRYDRATPCLQYLLKAVIGSDEPTTQYQRDRNLGRVLVTSTILNLRSRLTNYLPAIMSLVLWNNRIPKRVVQMFNRLGLSASHTFQLKAVEHLGQDSVRIAGQVALDPSKLKMLPYDNFNWTSKVQEVSATHGAVQHDEVSALLVVLTLPPGSTPQTAEDMADVKRFEASLGNRHKMNPNLALEAILPSLDDQSTFRKNSILHIAQILAEEVECFASFRSTVPKITDPKAITPHKTERYYLPTFDQEQGSTRGNMVVLQHYFFDGVLNIPKPVFERTMFFVLGDRLTTARDRAAQDQRAVDRSEHRADHLASFTALSGLMHVCMNKMKNIGRNMWGGSDKDDVSLQTLRDLLPNRSNVNLHQHDYYAWLRFLDTVLRSLVIAAAVAALELPSAAQLASQSFSESEFVALCTRIADINVLPSMGALEADGIKTLKGNTVSGHAVLTLFDLMTLREMRDAIKHGHPTRILRMLKFWTPMFYAGGGYNYSHECMELLHNYHHDWPKDTADVLLAGMLVNTTGKPDGFLEGDLDVEHLNKNIKDRTGEPNITSAYLSKVTPAVGTVRELTDQLFLDLGVEAQNQHHAHVRQHKDVVILANHLTKAKILDFSLDRVSEHAVVDLFRNGIHRLGGENGGHAKHLAKHKLRLRKRHERQSDTYQTTTQSEETPDGIDELLFTNDWELDEAREAQAGDIILEEEEVNVDQQYNSDEEDLPFGVLM